MITALLNKYRKRNKQKLREKKKNRKLEEKKASWTSRWGSDEFNPFWAREDFPDSIQELIDDGSIPQGASLVDIGCGSGYLSAMLSEQGFNVIGFDFASTAIERARAAHPEIPGKLRYFIADATAPMPFQETFRIGIDKGTFHMLPKINRPDYVNNISKIIEKGGLLLMFYARHIAVKLCRSSGDEPGEIMKGHILKLFTPLFAIEDIRPMTFKGTIEGGKAGFLIILRRK